LALVVLSVVGQRLDAVRAVLDGAEVVEVAARLGVHRATVHRWVARYLTGQFAGLADRSHRPHCSPRQVAGAASRFVSRALCLGVADLLTLTGRLPPPRPLDPQDMAVGVLRGQCHLKGDAPSVATCALSARNWIGVASGCGTALSRML
jgi:Helix-turn-helix domain